MASLFTETQLDELDKETKDGKEAIFTDIGGELLRYYQNYLQSPMMGMLAGNFRDRKLDDAGLYEAENLFTDPQVSACHHIKAFSVMNKDMFFRVPAKSSNPEKSAIAVDFMNWTLTQFSGNVKDLIYAMMSSSYYGNSKIAKKYSVCQQPGEYYGKIYYEYFTPLRYGLWDFDYDENDRIKGFVSLLNPSKRFPLDKIMYVSWLPTDNNPNGHGDFVKIFPAAKAKRGLLPLAMALATKHSKSKFAKLMGSKTLPDGAKVDIESILNKIEKGLAVFLPEGFRLELDDYKLENLDHFITFFRYLDSQIALAMLGTSMGHNENISGGNFSQSKQGVEIGTNNYTNYAISLIKEVIFEQYVKPLMLLNFDPDFTSDMYPEFCIEKPKEKDLEVMARVFEILVRNQLVDITNEEDFEHYRELFKLPVTEDMLKDIANRTMEEAKVSQILEKAMQLIISLKDKGVDVQGIDRELEDLMAG